MKFKSKIDLWFILFLTVIFGLILISLAYDKKWIGFSFVLFVIVFIGYLFLTTSYTIEDKKVFIKCGFLFDRSIEIQNIKKISESFNIMSSPAFSFNRLEILYNEYDTVLISPKEKKRFIEAIKKINPQIEIKVKP